MLGKNVKDKWRENRKMKIVKFKGGLGNQLFQYAFLRYMEVIEECENVKADLEYYKGTTGDSIRQARILGMKVRMNQASCNDLNEVLLLKHTGRFSSLEYKAKLVLEILLNKKYYFEKNREYRTGIPFSEKKYFDGYWQSWRYVEAVAKELRDEIDLIDGPSDKTKKQIEKISRENSVFIGIRRGDYFANKKAANHFGAMSEDYYISAIKHIINTVENPVFYIFSNDLAWVKENMNLPGKIVYREDEDQVSDLEELFVMASCKHAIISNSTFNWWGAWLIKNPEKIIIAPRNWFADGTKIDIVPQNWIKM